MPSLNSLKDTSAKAIASNREMIQYDMERIGTCWIWRKTLNWNGYGQTTLQGKTIGAHRVSYLIYKGEIPEGMVVRHCCPGEENRACVNPDHLILGSRADNNRDTVTRGKGGKGGPKKESKVPFLVKSASAGSDGIIIEMSRKRRNPLSIANRLGLPREHVLTVVQSICDREGRRDATLFERRFWSKVTKTESCWLWNAMTTAGYGRIRVDGKIVGAHLMSWRLHRGPIPNGMVVCHNCPGGDNPRCVNPQLLFVASQTSNLRDGFRKKRLRKPGAHAMADPW